MINQNTVFILGAGASKPYGYPTGIELRDVIIKNLDGMIQSGSGWINELGYSLSLVSEFNSKFNISRKFSIDSFLSHQKDEFVEIGKIAIVDAISQCESHIKLIKPENDDWNAYLINNLYNCSFDEVHENNVSFITFNYDRSLETALFTSLLASYEDKDDYELCSSKLREIPIVHMYGRMDELPWETKDGRDYGESCDSHELKNVSEKINLIQEARSLGIPKEANELIEEASSVYFLGMDLRNRENLELFNKSSLENKKIFATTYGLKEAEIIQIKNYFKKFGAEITTGSPVMMTLESIRNNAPLQQLDSFYI